MPALRQYLLPLAALATLTTATPDWHTECVDHQQQFCAEFNNLNGSTTIPDGYDSMLWPGWTALSPAPYHIVGPGGPDALAITPADPQAAYFAFDDRLGNLRGFWFACTGYYKGLGAVPFPCTIQVVTSSVPGTGSIDRQGEYGFSPNQTALQRFEPSLMAHVEFEPDLAERVYVYVTSGMAGTGLFLANVYYDVTC